MKFSHNFSLLLLLLGATAIVLVALFVKVLVMLWVVIVQVLLVSGCDWIRVFCIANT